MNQINVTQKIINSAQPLVKKTDEAVIKPVSKATKEFVDKLSNSTAEAIAEFIQKNAKPVRIRSADNKLFRYNNILLYKSNGEKAYNLEQNLTDVNDTGLAPKFVKYFGIGKNDFLTVMEVDSEKIIPYTKVADKIMPEVKQDFKTKVRTLVNDGILNREIFANKDALFVTPNAKKIVFADWGEISFLNATQKQRIIEVLNKWQI